MSARDRLPLDERLEQPAEILEVPVDDRAGDARARARRPRSRRRGSRRATTIAFVASSNCSRRCAPRHPAHANGGYRTVAYGNVTCMDVTDRHRRQRLLRASGWRSSCARRASRTSSYSNAATASAAPGTTTPIRAAPATSRRTSTRSRSRRTRTGRAPTPASPRSARTCERVVDDFGVAPKVRLNCEVTAGRLGRGRAALGARYVRRARSARRSWSPAPGRWWSRRSRTSRASASQGPAFHSARWDHSVDLRGKRVVSDRDRRLGDPVRARDRARRRAAARDPAHAAVGDAAQRTADHDASSGALYRAVPARPAGAARRRSTRRASCWCSASSSSRGR